MAHLSQISILFPLVFALGVAACDEEKKAVDVVKPAARVPGTYVDLEAPKRYARGDPAFFRSQVGIDEWL